jgi:predicted O-methyltransferase YrrM
MLSFITLYLGTLKRVVSTLILGILSESERTRINQLYAVYQKPQVVFPTDPYIIPKTDVFVIDGNETAVYDGVDECGFGHITEFELKAICHIVQKYQPKKIFKIGTFEGRTTLNMALNAPDAQVFTLDLPSSELSNTKMEVEAGEVRYIDKEQSGVRFLGKPAQKQIQQLYGDSATFDFTPYHNAIDLMFIDGSHAYDYVLSDTERALKMVKKGGVILWHDYTNWEGVREGLNQYYKNDVGFAKLKHIGGTSIVMMEI